MRAWLVALVVAAIVAGAEPGLTPDFRAILARDLRFSNAELADLERGRIARHALSGTSPSEVAAVGATRVNARKETFVDRFRDIATFKSGPDVMQIGRFSDPPTLDDLAPLTINKDDFDGRTCRVRDCGVRLPADVIVRFQREIDWKAPDADKRAAAMFKQVLLDNVRAYLSGAPGRITQYDDDRRPIRPADEFAGLLKSSPFIGRLVPGLPEHLAAFPTSPLAGAEDFLYWSKEKFGLTPFISVTHVTIAQTLSGIYVITTKDVYSSRYFDSSLAVAMAGDAAGAAGGFYLVYVNRSRASALKGPFGALRRAIVERRAKSSLDENLRTLKLRLEKGS
jgi:hypothetical protein